MKCLLCDNEADGLDGEHCQTHWEQVCDESFWDYVRSPEYLEIELIAEMESSEGQNRPGMRSNTLDE